MPLSPSARVSVSPDQLSTTVAGEEVILSMKDGVYYGLDPVGARIWAMLQEGPASLDDVADRIVAEFDVERDRALADLLALADDLRAQGLIEVVAESSR